MEFRPVPRLPANHTALNPLDGGCSRFTRYLRQEVLTELGDWIELRGYLGHYPVTQNPTQLQFTSSSTAPAS
jgi:hypothetical protein